MVTRLSKQDQIRLEKLYSRKFTERQITFCKFVAESIHSNTTCARKAGYSHDSAGNKASEMLNGVDFPHIIAYIEELREERERKYQVTMIGQLERLSELSEGAQKVNQYSAAISAEKLRSALGGLTVDRREVINDFSKLTKADIILKLVAMQKEHPQLLAHIVEDAEVIDEQRAGSELLEYVEEKAKRT